MTVQWSQSQSLPHTTLPPEIALKSDNGLLRLEMAQISTPDAIQSEAYISTVALFVCFASQKEGRVYLRLPSIWRNLWHELSDVQNDQCSIVSRYELRDIRHMVEIVDKEKQALEITKNRGITKRYPMMSKSNVQVLRKDKLVSNREECVHLWQLKSSSDFYCQQLEARSKLPIGKFKQQLLDMIERYPILIVCGETGCGKSTQLPAYILENELQNGRDCRIYCTEPRRISAISLARRVSEELGERKNDIELGESLVGYAIRLENKVSNQTRLVYATVSSWFQ